jgi:hypothetical protein
MGHQERKKPFGRPKNRGEDNIKMTLKQTVCVGVNWIVVAHGTPRNETSGCIKYIWSGTAERLNEFGPWS